MKDHTLSRQRSTGPGVNRDYGYSEEQNICCIPHCQRNRANHVSIHLCEHHITKAWAAYHIINGTPAPEKADPERDVHSLAARGTVYIFRIGDLIKIGWTSNPARRIIDLKPDAILHYQAGTRQDEANVHEQFKAHIAHGREWFHDNDEVRELIDKMRSSKPSW